MSFAHRFSGEGQPYEGLTTIRRGKVDWTGSARFVPEMLDQPLRWRQPKKIFVNSMSDLFHESLSNEEIATVFWVMAIAERHTFQVLTKRPKRALEWFQWVSGQQGAEAAHHPRAVLHMASARNGLPFNAGPSEFWSGHWPLPNVWLGVSVEDQKAADDRIPLLVQCPAEIRFVSYEPALGPVDFSAWIKPNRHDWLEGWTRVIKNKSLADIDWIIIGAESGNGARAFQDDWARAVRDQCVAADVKFFFKQKLEGRKKVGLPMLDGKQWAEFPETRA